MLWIVHEHWTKCSLMSPTDCTHSVSQGSHWLLVAQDEGCVTKLKSILEQKEEITTKLIYQKTE